jgi:hypothetical protein
MAADACIYIDELDQLKYNDVLVRTLIMSFCSSK